MQAMRNYLVHGDVTARKKAAEMTGGDPSRLLTAGIAVLCVDAANNMFAHAMHVTGLLAPTRQRKRELHPGLAL